jgi:hypothetical protein
MSCITSRKFPYTNLINQVERNIEPALAGLRLVEASASTDAEGN